MINKEDNKAYKNHRDRSSTWSSEEDPKMNVNGTGSHLEEKIFISNLRFWQQNLNLFHIISFQFISKKIAIFH